MFDYQPGQTQKSVALRGETWDKIKNFFKDINVKIQEHSKKFGQWVKDMWGKGLDKLKEKYGAIKAIAMEVSKLLYVDLYILLAKGARKSPAQ